MKTVTVVSKESFILTIDNCGACYDEFVYSCYQVLRGHKPNWSVVIIKAQQCYKPDDNETFSFPKETIEAAKEYLNHRLKTHFITDILSCAIERVTEGKNRIVSVG